jgi:capsular polysaccharide biosynthesis protein
MTLLKASGLAKIIWEGRKIILVVAIVAVATGIIFENYRTPSWKTTVPILIAPTGEKNTPDFNYDHFYALEASDTLTDSIEEWLKNAALRQVVAQSTKIKFKSKDWRFWETNNWKVSKKAPQLIEVSFNTATENSAKELDKHLKTKISAYLNSFNQSGEPYFNLTNSTSAVEFVAPAWSLVIIFSLIWGIVIGILLVLEKENLRKRE